MLDSSFSQLSSFHYYGSGTVWQKNKMLWYDGEGEYLFSKLHGILLSQGIFHINYALAYMSKMGLPRGSIAVFLRLLVLFSSLLDCGELIKAMTSILLTILLFSYMAEHYISSNTRSHLFIVIFEPLSVPSSCFLLKSAINNPQYVCCIFLGYSPKYKGNQCYDPHVQGLCTFQQVTIDNVPFSLISLLSNIPDRFVPSISVLLFSYAGALTYVTSY